jgi:hypothetical protein
VRVPLLAAADVLLLPLDALLLMLCCCRCLLLMNFAAMYN